MMTIRSEQVVMWDCDETLVMHYEEDKILDIVCPYDGKFIAVAIHQKHVQLLKDHKARGFYNVVWSAHGFAWAEAVVKALELEPYVDICMSKSCKFIDDLPANEVLVNRVYLTYKPGDES
jgi:hypothetical protein